ncbi:MAG TPA: CoA transferase [Pseudonocardia sp.]|nr:CoA transferase [Pseudonocardia sp.]
MTRSAEGVPDPAGPPLGGVRVVDLSTSYAGPTATMYLADLGADVIKVERPGHGDDARAWGPPFVGGQSAWFDSANRNKRSIALDLRAPGGADVLHDLLDRADVLVANLNPGKLASLGLDPERLRARHPRLVYCALSGFGLTGPDATLGGYDLVAQARSGLMSVTGERGGTPQRVSTALSDVVSGLVAALAIVAAVRRQDRTGQGEVVDVSLLDADLALMAPRIASYLAGEPEPGPSGGTDSVLAVYQVFETADGALVLAIGSDGIWRRFCPLVGLPELADDPRLATNAGRRAHREEVLARITERLAGDTARAWLERFAAAGVPAAPVQTLSQVVTDRQVVARDAVLAMRRDGATVHGIRSPWRLASQPAPPARPAPVLGGDTVAVLREHGLAEDRIAQLLAEGAVQAPGVARGAAG